MDRRSFILGSSAAATGLWLAPSSLHAQAKTGKRLIVITLNGGLDGLSLLPPTGDAGYGKARGDEALAVTGRLNGALWLSKGFALHPAALPLLPLFEAGQVAAWPAMLSGRKAAKPAELRRRFRQGGTAPEGAAAGWLARAIGQMGDAPSSHSFSTATGLLDGLAGKAASPAPGQPLPIVGLTEKAAMLCRHDPMLRNALAADVEIRNTSGGNPSPPGMTDAAYLPTAIDRIAPLLAQADGPRIAVLETGGWDIRAAQGGATGPLAARIGGLALGLAKLARALKPVWKDSVVLVAADHGRTIGLNKKGGTAPGLGTSLLVLGGGVRGGLREDGWPGLTPGVKLAGGRGLAPAIDSRAVFKAVLAQQLGLSRAVLDKQVFPRTGGLAPVKGLFR